jgi:hypothetical protein
MPPKAAPTAARLKVLIKILLEDQAAAMKQAEAVAIKADVDSSGKGISNSKRSKVAGIK